jgi:hypothetical protein
MSYREKAPKIKLIQHDFSLSQKDRITYVYARSIKDHEIIEVVNVSYDILIYEKWYTIIRYDSNHGYLHRHERLTLRDEKDIVEQIDLSGTHSDWLTWALNDLIKHFREYKQTFFDNNSIIDNE